MVSFGVLTTLGMKMDVFRDLLPCNVVDIDQRFRRACTEKYWPMFIQQD